MKTLVKFNKKRTICGFTFHAGWFGEFSDRGELVKVYAYPYVNYNSRERLATWNACRIFTRKFDTLMTNWEYREKLPSIVCWHFDNITKYRKRCYIENLRAGYVGGNMEIKNIDINQIIKKYHENMETAERAYKIYEDEMSLNELHVHHYCIGKAHMLYELFNLKEYGL